MSRVRDLERQLTEQQALLRDGTPTQRRVAELQIEKLEGLLDNAQRDEKLRTARMQELRDAEIAKTEARQAEEQAALEAELRRRYNLAAPKPVTDAEWEQVKDAVLHKYRLRQMEQTDVLIKQAATRYRI